MKNPNKLTSSKASRLNTNALPLLRGMFITPSIPQEGRTKQKSSVDLKFLMELNSLNSSVQ